MKDWFWGNYIQNSSIWHYFAAWALHEITKQFRFIISWTLLVNKRSVLTFEFIKTAQKLHFFSIRYIFVNFGGHFEASISLACGISSCTMNQISANVFNTKNMADNTLTEISVMMITSWWGRSPCMDYLIYLNQRANNQKREPDKIVFNKNSRLVLQYSLQGLF